MADGAFPRIVPDAPAAKFPRIVPDAPAATLPRIVPDPVAMAPVVPVDQIPPWPEGLPETVARGPTTVPGPEADQPSLISDILTQGWQGLSAGATQTAITNSFGVAAADQPLIPGVNAYRQQLREFMSWPAEQQQAFRLQLEQDHSPTAKTVQSMVSDLLDGNMLPEEVDSILGPDPVATPMRQRPDFLRAKQLEAWKERNFPTVPGYQEGAGGAYRGLMEGLGTVAASAGTWLAGGPVLAGASALLGGVGETVQNIYSDENIAAAEAWQRGEQGVQPGLSAPAQTDVLAGQGADQLAGLASPGAELEMQRRVDDVLQGRLDKGALWGTVAGATDLAPLETLFHLIPGMKNASRITKVLLQAATEGGQEGIQQLLQNTAIGRALSSGLAESVGLGGGVGAISQVISELIGLATPGRNRGQPLTLEQRRGLAERLLPSTGGRLDVEAPPPPPPPGPEAGTQVLPTGTETPPAVQPVPGPAPPEVTQVTPDAIQAANAARLAAEAQYPPGDPRRTAALNNYVALIARFITESQAAPPTGPVLGPMPARPAGGEPGGMPAAAAPGPPETATQVLPTNVPPAPPLPVAEGGGTAAPAPEAGAPLPVAEPPAPVVVTPPAPPPGPPVAGEEAVSAPESATSAPRPTAPPRAEPLTPEQIEAQVTDLMKTTALKPGDVGYDEAAARFRKLVAPAAPAPEPALARVEPAPAPSGTEELPTPKSILGPVPPPQADLKSFVISQGGVRPTPNLSAQDATQQVGLLDNAGMTMDNMRQAMTDAGYIDEGTDANDAEQMIIDAMQQDAPKVYPRRALDQKQAADFAGRKERQAQLDQVASEIDDAIRDTGLSNITEKERDQMIGQRFTKGIEPDEAVDFILRRRAEPTEAQTVPADEGEEAPFDAGELPSEPGAEGKPQLFMPGTERAETAGARVSTGPELRAALKATGAAQDQFGRRYSVRARPAGGHALLIDGKEAGTSTTPKGVIDQAVIEHAAVQKRKAPPGKKQKGVTDLSLFSDEHKQTSMPVEQPAPAEEPRPIPPEAAEPEPKSLGAAAKTKLSVIERRGGSLGTDSVYYVGYDGKVPGDSRGYATILAARREIADIARKNPDNWTIDRQVEDQRQREERLTEEAAGPAGPEEEEGAEEPGLWGDDPVADQQQEADDEATTELNILTERGGGRVGVTPTFRDVTMSTTTPMNADAAYTDAGVDPDQAKNMTPEGRFQALAALFRSKFGFKSVSRQGTYGQAKGQDAVDMLLDGYRAIRAMMHVLGMPETSASLGGTLSLTIGRITRRSAFLGSYNPQDQSLELVGRSNGFAHEWAHALDHWLMDNVFGPITANAEKLASRFTRNDGLNPGVAIEDHFIRLMNAIFFNDGALAARVLDLQIKASKVYGPKYADASKRGQPTQEALTAQRMLDDIAAGRSNLVKEKSDYYKTALDYGRGNPYWTNPAEMLARAFEAYVAFRVAVLDPDFPSNFMTKGEAAYTNSADQRLAKTFPKAADRMRIFGAFDTLMGIVNTQTALGGTVSAMPTANELLADDLLYMHAARVERAAREKARQRGIVARWKNQLLLTTSLSGWNQLLDQIRDNIGARFGAPKDLMNWAQRGSMLFKGVFFTEAAIANTLVNRPQNAKAKVFMQAVASQLFELAPGEGTLARETWGEAVSAYVRTYGAKLENILDAHGIPLQVPLDPKSPEGRAQVGQRDRLASILTTGTEMPGTSADERRAAAQIRTQIFDEIWRDAGRAGLDIGYVEDAPYLPIIPEPHAIHADRIGFIAAATKLYQLVFDRAAGTKVDASVLQDAIQDIKNWNTPHTLNDPDVIRLRAKADRLRVEIRELRKKQSAALRPDLLQPQIDALVKEQQDTLDELATHIKPMWATAKAEQWHDAFIRGEYSAMDTLGPQTKHTKERVLPSESQAIMAEFMVSDPVSAAMIYINSMARKIEYSGRFGQQSGGREDFENILTRPNSPMAAEMKARGLSQARAEDRVTAIMELTDPMLDNRLQMLLTEAQRAGALTEDLTTLRGQVEYMTGRKSEASAMMRGLSNLVYALGSVALMPRAWWTSLMETVTTLARTGDIKTTGKVLSHQMKEFVAFAGTTVEDINDLARTIGLIASEGQDVMLQVTLGDIPMSSRLSKFMAEFYERIGLAALTRMQKRAVLAGFNMWLNKLLRMAKGEPGAAAGDKAVARANLADLGIAENEIKPLDDWLHARGRDRQMNSADAKTPIGLLWAAAARRFVHSVVQEGTKATSPKIMSHPMGRLTFGLMRFAYTFTRNILARPIRQALRDEALRRTAGEGRQAAAARAFRDNLLYRGVLGMGALWLGQFLVALLREWLFNGEQTKRHLEEGDFVSWIARIAASRSGVYGPFDGVIQAFTGLRYQRDITSMTAGPFMNLILNFGQSLGEAYYNNSPNTSTSERNLTTATLRTFQTPLIMAGLTVLPGGRYVGPILAGVGMLASSNSLMQWETSLIAGPPNEPRLSGFGKKQRFGPSGFKTPKFGG